MGGSVGTGVTNMGALDLEQATHWLCDWPQCPLHDSGAHTHLLFNRGLQEMTCGMPQVCLELSPLRVPSHLSPSTPPRP